MPVDITNVINTLKIGVTNIAETDLKDYLSQATRDGQSIIDSLNSDLQTWTLQLENGEITKSDFAFNVKGKKDSLEMAALEQAGLAEIQVDQFKADVCNLIITTISALIP
jgi:hypothetical protein